MSRARHLVHDVHMTHQPASGSIPTLTLGWRLRMSLDYANISVQQMANQLGVSRATLSRWMADKGERPKRAYISQWALSTGVPFEWVDSGQVTGGGDGNDGGNQVTRKYDADEGAQVTPIHQTWPPLATNLQKAA